MANGASTALFQQAIQMLLQGRTPSPLAPVPLAPTGAIGPLSMDTTAALRALQPEPVPPQMPQPVDMDAIRARFGGLAGPEPVAPATQPISLLQKVALALQGFGAGTQGQGPQFLAGLREERARPQREFEAKKERFESRKAELGLLAEQEISGVERRRETRIQELLDNQFEREFKEGARRLNLRDQKELDLFRDTLLAKRQREDDERQADRLRKQQEQQIKIKLADLSSKYRSLGARDDIATELAQKDLDPNFKLTPTAQKWHSARVAIDEARANKIATGAAGGGAGGGIDKATTKLVEEFNAVRENLITAVARGDAAGQKQFRLRLDQLVRRLAGRRGVEAGYGKGNWPYVKVNGALSAPEAGQQQQGQPAAPLSMFPDLSGGLLQPQAAPQGQSQPPRPAAAPTTINAADVQEFMRLSGIADENEARRQLQAAGAAIR